MSSKKNPSISKGGYRFSGNTHEIFEQFFGTNNPFTITLDGNNDYNETVIYRQGRNHQCCRLTQN
jgi:hypothetical protein